MGRSKDLFIRLMEELFQDFSEPPKKAKKMETEEVLFEKKGYITRIKIFFTEEGNAHSIDVQSEYIPSEEEKDQNQLKVLQKQLSDAVEQEDYTLASEIQKQMKQMEKPTE